MKPSLGFPLSFLLLFGLASLAHAAPPILNYSGQVAVDGSPFTGTAYLKFAFVDGSGQFSYWSHDGTSANGSEPDGNVSVAVSGGLYSIMIGDTDLAGMGEIDEDVFQNHNDVHLRVWFSDGVNGFERISPDRPFASVPYAMSAGTAGSAGIAPGSVTLNMLGSDVQASLGSTIDRSRLSADVLADLNKTVVITREMLPEDVQSDLNRTITLSDLAPEVVADLNDSVADGSITTNQLNEQILKYLRPEVVSQPIVPLNLYDGSTIALNAAVEGKFVEYQWFKNGQVLEGETNASLVMVNINGSTHDGNYSLTVSNDFGSVTSNIIELKIDQNLKTSGTLVISEHSSLGSAVGTFISNNPFGGDTNYTLVGGEGDSHNNLFILEENGTLRSQAYFDFENNASTLSIRVRSDFGNSILDEKQFTVELQDIDDEITLEPDRSLTIPEHSPRTHLVAQFKATNSLELNASFQLYDGEGSSDNNLFTILQSGELYTRQSLDYETNASSYSVRVRADLGNGLFKEQSYTIELLDLEEQALDQISSIQSYLDQVSQNGVGRVVITSENDLVISESLSLPADLNVTFFSKGDTFVNANIQQSSAQTLSLITGKNLEILSTISSSHQDGQVLIAYGQISSATDSVYLNLIRGSVNLMSGYNLHCSTSGGEAVKLFYVITELGTENSRSSTDLQGILSDPDRNYALGADINASATENWNFVQGYTVEGEEAQDYYNWVDFTVPGFNKGFEPLEANSHFLGLGHVIDDLWVHFSAFGRYDPEPFPSGGLFKSFKNGKLANLTLSNLNVSGGTYTAALVARSENAMIQNCHTSGKVTTKARDHSLFSDFIAPYVGGIVGDAINTQISFCSNKASISGFYSTGGIAGNLQNSTILNCYNSGNISIGSSHYNDTHGTALQNFINEPTKGAQGDYGNFDFDLATQFIGGLAGSMVNSSISHSYNAGDVAWLQAIYGTKDDQSLTNGSFWDPDLSSLNSSEGGQAVQPSQEDLGVILSSSGFDFNSSLNSWGPVVGDNWPILNAEKDFRIPGMSILGDANITQLQGVAWVDPGVEAHDVRDGNLSGDVTVSGTLDVNTTGTYTLTYTVSDAAGNEASLTRTVNIVAGQASTHTADLNASVSLEMIWVEPGTFTMGQDGVATPVHEVTLTQGFYLGKYEVTQAQYEAVMTGNNDGLNATPSGFGGNPNRPVENILYEDIQKFLTRLNSQQTGNIPEGWAFVLPTEAQWEYACRAGTTTAYSWGDVITSDDANYNWDGEYNTGADFKQTRDVGQYSANPWGFFDMHGNVREWTADWYAAYSSGAQTDPEGPATGSDRVNRGADWTSSGIYLRSAFRNINNPSYRRSYVGFRVGFRQITEPPTDLNSTTTLTIAENQPTGTIVGEFNATDPDGDAITYHFVNGDNNNSLFTLETNGTLKTATVFDYETDPSTYTITVQAKDELNASIEGNFTVTLLNDAPSTYTVSGGQFGTPYYNFTDGNGNTPDFATRLLFPGEIYHFTDVGVSGSHPFMIGESYGDTTSSLVSGGPLNGSGGTITVTIPSDFNGSLYYFCTNHASMVQEFKVRRPNHMAELNASVALEMIWVEPGTFTMGQDGVATPVHEVTLTKGFYLGKYEVTQAQYEAVMTGNTDGLSATPSQYGGNADRPVETVSWDDIQKFLARLNAQEAGNIPAGWAYVLPTEAQWEYACRAGTTTAYSWGDSITTSNANYNSNIGQTRDVGNYAANPWGFFDMQGNVWEWTADWSGSYSSGAQIDPEGPATGSYRVYRGGAWTTTGPGLRSANRYLTYTPSSRYNYIGFRVGFQQQSADVASPEMSILGDANITQLQGVAWVDPGVEANDERDGNLTSSVSVSGTVDVNTTGTYTLTYTVSDAAGNEASLTRTVNIVAGQASTHTADLNASVALEMIWVEPGTFTMGSPTTEAGRNNTEGRETQHEVTLSQGFYLGKYEVTQAQYEAVMTGNTDGLSATPSQWPNNPDRPVEKVSHDDIQKFLTLLNSLQAGNIPAGWAYVLPTEAQWEYACRAGTTTAYSWGDSISASDANWNHGSDANQTENVGQYSANPWGFFDMHGNVWEWTADAYANYATGAQTDPFNVGTTGSSRVYRGGSWYFTGAYLRSAYRRYGFPSTRSYIIGFRVGFQQQ